MHAVFCISAILNKSSNIITDKIRTHNGKGFLEYLVSESNTICLISNCHILYFQELLFCNARFLIFWSLLQLFWWSLCKIVLLYSLYLLYFTVLDIILLCLFSVRWYIDYTRIFPLLSPFDNQQYCYYFMNNRILICLSSAWRVQF